LPEGVNELTVDVVDAAGNTATTTQNVTVDSEVTAPTIALESTGSDSVYNLEELGDDGTITATIAIPDAVENDLISINGETARAITAEEITAGEITVEVAPGAEVTAQITDQAGNTSESVTADALGADTGVLTAPTDDDEAAAITSDLTDDSNSGSTEDTVTNDSTPEITGVTEAGASVTVTYIDAEGGEYTTDPVIADENGKYTVAIPDSNALPEGVNELTVDVVDVAGNEDKTIQNVTVDTEVTAPTITNVIDADGDLVNVTLYGTGEVGQVITLHAISESATAGNNTQVGDYVAVTTTNPITVDANGNWSVDISAMPETPLNDNEFFKATQTDIAGNVSDFSNVSHFWHGEYQNVLTETEDDFVMMGTGNDTISINKNDDNDHVVIDGGDGEDTARFDGKQSDYVITTDSNGHTIVTENVSTDSDDNGSGDINELRNFESIIFTGDETHVEITGVAISSSFSEVSIYSGSYLTTGAGAVLNGGIFSGTYTTIGALGTLEGNISSGGYTTAGAGAKVTGSVLSGEAVTAGADSTIDGAVAAVAAITEGAGATAGTSQHALDPSLMVSEQLDAKMRVADAQDTLKAMEGTTLASSLGNTTLVAGVYESGGLSTTAGTTLKLDGQGLANQTWIFNVVGTLALGADTKIEIINAGEGASVIWNAYSGFASIGANAEILGTVYAQDYISVGANTSITGPNGTNGGLFTQNNYMIFGAGVSVGNADNTANSANAASANEVTGTAKANSLVTIHSEESVLGTVTTDNIGNFTYTLTALNVITLAAETNQTITASIDIGSETITSDAFTYNDQLGGSYGDDTLIGSVGIDTIEGGIGDDILAGGFGNDYLIGGDGADTFIWNDGDTGVDHIKDFNLAEGDKLDLSDILLVTEGDVLDHYLNFSSDGTNTTIDVFVGGDASDAVTPSQTIILDGVDLVGSSDAVIINDLFSGDNAGALIISDISTIDLETKVIDIPDDSQ
ncbi:beta strand repeat-containing protein, partial [Shewanella psychromarinicola]|uniref:beta strand repeat-containing protein n=1 Tax=Shewanella psychromarinicola TaxID=2487742 RepID=UPI003F4B8339